MRKAGKAQLTFNFWTALSCTHRGFSLLLFFWSHVTWSVHTCRRRWPTPQLKKKYRKKLRKTIRLPVGASVHLRLLARNDTLTRTWTRRFIFPVSISKSFETFVLHIEHFLLANVRQCCKLLRKSDTDETRR